MQKNSQTSQIIDPIRHEIYEYTEKDILNQGSTTHIKRAFEEIDRNRKIYEQPKIKLVTNSDYQFNKTGQFIKLLVLIMGLYILWDFIQGHNKQYSRLR
jgi:hypothetical protein